LVDRRRLYDPYSLIKSSKVTAMNPSTIPLRTAPLTALPRHRPSIHQQASAPAEAQVPSRTAGVPALPSPSPAVAEAVRPDRTWPVCDDRHGFTGLREEWKARPARPEDLPELREHLALLDSLCGPADRPWLLSRVLALLSHYRQEANPPQVEAMVAEDWVDDLGEFPAWAIEEAARRWRRTRKFRPAICEIRGLAEDAVEEFTRRRDRLRQVVRFGSPCSDRSGGQDRIAQMTRAAIRRGPV
jgi:hypothetical protein